MLLLLFGDFLTITLAGKYKLQFWELLVVLHELRVILDRHVQSMVVALSYALYQYIHQVETSQVRYKNITSLICY
jgi:uncharacterized protein involved in response to NO